MVIKQPNYSWIALIVLGICMGGFVIGVLLHRSDISNPITNTTASDITRAVATEDSKDRQVAREATSTSITLKNQNEVFFARATQTAVAIAANQKAEAARVAPTQTAIAIMADMDEKTQSNIRRDNLLAILAPMILVMAAIVLLTWVGAQAYLQSLQRKTQLLSAQGTQREQAIQWSISEAQRIRNMVELLHERRRHLELWLAVPESDARREAIRERLSNALGSTRDKE